MYNTKMLLFKYKIFLKVCIIAPIFVLPAIRRHYLKLKNYDKKIHPTFIDNYFI